ncbi:malonyl CoA-acyl carrier protein transacylase [Thiohalobacter thiocyanaticus]|uniref:Malonyl CoA-acyl carrier protein transacylase n=1 Tax=Thiohalobacter thiocyanaticus TaxID=585455 RepID=A0A1Z4VRF8_9GAMM|nr:ACP S-malonyltransferase [Thiohalobacter thiocyanaticus]BAZ94221.1 malonyl CoA-acyl carrier protein transacylase [Thiohalobacter thiocyanaticus]
MTDFDYTLAYVFPGQGSQSVGMLAELAAAHPVVGETFAEASDVLGYDLWQLSQDGPAEQLNQTDRTQPAMLAAGVAVWRVLAQATDKRPAMLAGHSLGEYSALVCAGVLEFAAAVKLVESRARFMQEAVPAGAGAMAAILGLDDDAVREVCRQAAEGEVVEPVNFNAPGQVVIAGGAAAVERAVTQAKAAGARRAVPLPVSVPSHCSLMQPAAEALSAELARTDLRPPSIDVIHNVDVRAHSDANEIRELLARQLHNPVRWVETVQYMQAEGVTRLIECGPGKVLAGLNKRIAKEMTALPVYDPTSLEAALEQI